MDKKPIISVKNLAYSFNKTNEVIENVSFTIYQKDLVAIIGHNGSGKTTLVKLILGLLKNKIGKIEVKGKLSYIPQKYNQDYNFPGKVKEILDLECCDCSLRDEILVKLDIENLVNKQFKILSGGQQQRVLIALSLLSNPDILILDEPIVGVDSKTQENFYSLLKKLNEERNLTILFITHDTGMISDYFNKIICVGDRKVYFDDAKNIHSLLHSTYGKTFHELHHNHHGEDHK
jgi:zinc transport system ATP-binding protein